jgi:large subunit ribosomal protein L17
MRHHNQNRKFGREEGVRRAFMRSLAVALITKERIRTTLPRAKALRPLVERLVTHAKRNTLASRRLIMARLGEKGEATEKLAKTIAPRYSERRGGYTRITKITTSRTDAAPMAIVEFV